MVEPIGICEKHELPLDRNGECELCRLSEMPSKAPPERSAWWAVVIPLVLLLAAVAWAFSAFGPDPEAPPQRGVQVPPEESEAPAPPKPEPPAQERRAPEPKEPPTRSTLGEAPAPDDIPRPEDFQGPKPTE